jgi:hypothetical protein
MFTAWERERENKKRVRRWDRAPTVVPARSGGGKGFGFWKRGMLCERLKKKFSINACFFFSECAFFIPKK